MTELEAARLVASGELPSPYKFGEMTLFALRMTGTGMAYRNTLDEFVWRDASIALSDEFLARAAAGVPVVWEHPEKGSLNSKEFGKRVIGSTMLGYIKDNDAWCIARCYDDEAIDLMTKGQLSTSPGVVFRKGDGNVQGEAPDGTPILIEGIPSILDHLAVCAAGVWDKGGDPTGVLNDTLPQLETEGHSGMAEEDKEKAAADASRQDAAAAAKHDAIMDAIAKIDSRFEKMDARVDAFEKEKKDSARKDAARKDKFGKRQDGESYKDWSKRHDAEEKEMCDALKTDGADEKDCKDTASSARHDAEEDEKRHDKDFDKWAKEEEDEPEHKKDKAKKDAASRKDSEESEEKKEKEKEEREDAARKDSAAMTRENEDMKARLAAMEAIVKGITTETPGSERDALATAQTRADAVSAMLGDRAPAPLAVSAS
jgi:hypothetical protein